MQRPRALLDGPPLNPNLLPVQQGLRCGPQDVLSLPRLAGIDATRPRLADVLREPVQRLIGERPQAHNGAVVDDLDMLPAVGHVDVLAAKYHRA